MGMFFRSILDRTSHLNEIISQHLMMHNLYENFKISDTKNRALENLKHLEKIIELETNGINEMIKAANSILINTVSDERIPLINHAELRKIFRERFDEVYTQKELRKLSNENFSIKLNRILSKSKESLQNFLNSVDKSYYFEGFENLKNGYKDGISDAININSIAQFKDSIFVVGRTIEEGLDRILKSAIKNKKIKRISITDTKYGDKIGKLRGANIIDEKLFHELNSIRIDRNKSGHPVNKKFTVEENKFVISKGIVILLELQKKLGL
jgi:hypothetical protein